MAKRRHVKFIVAGQIRDEFIIDVNGKVTSNLMGGSLLYAAASAKQWGNHIGLLGVVTREYRKELLAELENANYDVRGIKTADDFIDLRSFVAYPNAQTCLNENPVSIFAANNLPFPKELIDYAINQDEATRLNLDRYSRILLENIPRDYLEAAGAHICPLDISCQIKLSTLLQQGTVRTLTIQPHRSVMTPKFFDEITVLAKDASALMVHELDLQTLFLARTSDLWEMMATLCSFGCSSVVVRNQRSGYYVFDAYSSSGYLVPDYPVKVIDPTGEMDVFCGAYLVKYQQTNDSVLSAIQGSVAASIKKEGTGPFSIQASLQGLDLARMEHISNRVVKIRDY